MNRIIAPKPEESIEFFPREMTDREMLFLAYGALKAITPENYATSVVEEHLYPPKVILAEKKEDA